MTPEGAFVVSAADGMYVDATPAALELFGTDLQGLRVRRVGDFSPPDCAEVIADILEWTRQNPGMWQRGLLEILRVDGERALVRYAAVRRPRGQLVMWLEPVRADHDEAPVSDILMAWRRKVVELATLTPGSDGFVLAEAEVEWLSSEYQRLFAVKSEEYEHES